MSKKGIVARSKVTMLWFEVGTIRELCHAIGDLRLVLRRRGWLDAPGFTTLNDLDRRWRGKLSGLRNRAAFHVDRDVLAVGLSRIPDGPLVLAHGDDLQDGWLAFGDAVLMQGVHESQEKADELAHTVIADRGTVHVALMQIFANSIRRAGLTYRDERAP
jgi:hypothetical protein